MQSPPFTCEQLDATVNRWLDEDAQPHNGLPHDARHGLVTDSNHSYFQHGTLLSTCVGSQCSIHGWRLITVLISVIFIRTLLPRQENDFRINYYMLYVYAPVFLSPDNDVLFVTDRGPL